MNQINDQEAFDTLHKAGFTELEIKQLTRLRRDYKINELDQAPLDYARLQFVRWLVTTGRLTDQLSREDPSCTSPIAVEEAARVPLAERQPTEKVPIFKTIVSGRWLKRQLYLLANFSTCPAYSAIVGNSWEMFLGHFIGKEAKP